MRKLLEIMSMHRYYSSFSILTTDLCFIHEWRDLEFKGDSEQSIFGKLFCQKSAEKKSTKKFFSFLVLMSDLELESSLISKHAAD